MTLTNPSTMIKILLRSLLVRMRVTVSAGKVEKVAYRMA